MNLRKDFFWMLMTMAATVGVIAQEPDQVSVAVLAGKQLQHSNVSRGGRNGQGHARFGLDTVDSILNFNKHFKANGLDQNGNPQHIWYTSMVGNPPELGGTTVINAGVIPVSLDLRDYDGSPRYVNGELRVGRGP